MIEATRRIFEIAKYELAIGEDDYLYFTRYSIPLEHWNILLVNTSTGNDKASHSWPCTRKIKHVHRNAPKNTLLYMHSTPNLPHARNAVKNKGVMHKICTAVWIGQ
jgi:hypothetical protein